MNEQMEVMVVEAEYVQLGSVKVSSPADVVIQATDIATELARVIKSQKLSTRISGREFVRVEGWSTLGAMLGVLPCELSTERQEDGGYISTVELVRVSDGAIIGRGSALCGMDEKDRNGKQTWANRAEYARRSMAITRATGKAYRLAFSWIMTLAGYEPTPAEEMDGVNVESERPPKKSNGATMKEVWARWNAVHAEAQELGIEVDPLPANSVREQIYARGKELKSAIEAIKAVIEAGLTENQHSVKATLKHSTLPHNADKETVVNWFKQYRGARDSDASVEDAAAIANAWLAGESA